METRTAPADPEVLTSNLRVALDGRFGPIRDAAREYLNRADLLPDPSLTLEEARTRSLRIMRELVPHGLPHAGFRKEHGGTGDVGAAIVGIEMLGYADLSLMVKAGVQWGLFGGAIENLGTATHHKQYVVPLINLDVLGCFGMTETGHGSNVQALQTVATYDSQTGDFVLNSEGSLARKDYIGGAAEHATVAAVFAQLVTGGPGEEASGRGVHCFVVPIRDEAGNDLPGITTSDCGYKGGLAGVDNGRIVFDNVRVPRANLLNKYADVGADGSYTSPIENENKRFFTMLGTLIRGRVSVAATSGAAARKALTIASRYALVRKQFDTPDSDDEVIIADYLVHQRKLLPLIARSYALAFAQNELTEELHEVQTADEVDADRQRQLESAAAGLKAMTSWHAQNTITVCREACGGAGYLDANQLTILRRDIDVFTTFEGDNTVLTQLVAKELLSAYAEDVRGLNAVGWTRFIAGMARDVILERSAARQVIQTILDSSDEDVEESDLSNRGTQLRLLRNREDHLLRTAATRMQRAQSDDEDPFEVFNSAQDHILKVGSAHTERVVLEAFIEAIDSCDSKSAQELLEKLCDLFVYSTLEADLSWFLMHRHVSTERAKAIRRGVNQLCEELRPHLSTLVDAFGIPEALLATEMIPDN
ncbi:acyl-CoA oxidase [Mycobacteroides chelonae]|jgi:acyl-CoA oxidase|uniref:acyl-CoA dehydrogenase family protein n=1 Tax=Mycobacteroides chelonae TaxID=1774 RepID=UPI0008A84D8C|nr:acyl-CoA dehydrogenase [Mycobacteroides chelonae]OHT78654.1 acyl-CoA oxidase [Mycobacteroides chelonae]OHU61744.1 acyl-CoA oxidase [Mycobacteroides chelonae]